VNEFQPEFATLIQNESQALENRALLMPFASPLGWSRTGPDDRAFPLFRLQRSLILRQTVRRGEALASGHLLAAEKLAARYAAALSYQVDRLFIAQSLLPFLWRKGVLGGRRFSVLMERMPVRILEAELDKAAEQYSQSPTLRDFRAPQWYSDAEEEALDMAELLYSPHAQVAQQCKKTVRLPWQQPVVSQAGAAQKDLVIFPGPTLARKGAYAVRDAMRAAMRSSHLRLGVTGSDLEGAGFWDGLTVERFAWNSIPWHRVACVLQPALVENWPRRLLEAKERSCPLIVTGACGIDAEPNHSVVHVPFGDADAVRLAVKRVADQHQLRLL
jgi:hypothetical protein